MYPDLFTIPIINKSVGGYAFFVLLGIVAGLLTAVRRAKRVRARHDLFPTIFLIIAFFGLAGCRIFYVIHHWEDEFAHLPNRWEVALNPQGGGAELYGGVILVLLSLVIYFQAHRLSARLYLDILAPSAAITLAFGKVACFMYGCCWGGLCVDQHQRAALPWAVRFPYGSLPMIKGQWAQGQVRVSDELLYRLDGEAAMIPLEFLQTGQAKHSQMIAHAQQTASDESGRVSADEKRFAQRVLAMNESVLASQPPDVTTGEHLARLRALSTSIRTLPVHPVQLYSAIGAAIIALLLSAVFKRRRRDGQAAGLMLIVYPVYRIIEEHIRVDNPRDVLGLTPSTVISLGLILAAGGWLWWLSKRPAQYV